MWFGVIWCGLVWFGVVWCGLVWFGVVWCGLVWFSVVWCGLVWFGVVWCGLVWFGVVWCGLVWLGVAWCGFMWFDTNQSTSSKQQLHTAKVHIHSPGVSTDHFSSSSMCRRPSGGMYACAKVFPLPSKGFPSPCLPLKKSILMSSRLLLLFLTDLKFKSATSLQCCVGEVG